MLSGLVTPKYSLSLPAAREIVIFMVFTMMLTCKYRRNNYIHMGVIAYTRLLTQSNK